MSNSYVMVFMSKTLKMLAYDMFVTSFQLLSETTSIITFILMIIQNIKDQQHDDSGGDGAADDGGAVRAVDWSASAQKDVFYL